MLSMPGLPELLLIALIVALVSLPLLLYLKTLYKALSRCSIEARAMSPGLVWLMLIPLFNVIWHFFVVTKLATTLRNEFGKRGMMTEPAPGQSVGLAMCILLLVGWVPVVGIRARIGATVCWIVYWNKIASLSRKLAIETANTVPPPVTA